MGPFQGCLSICKKCASLKLNASASGSEKVWMKWLKCCAKRFCLCSWNGLRRLREQVVGSGVEILWIYNIWFSSLCKCFFLHSRGFSNIHMSLTNWANRCFKTGGIDYCKSDPGKHFVDLHTLFQSLSNLFPKTWWVSIYWLPKFMKNPILVCTLTPLPGAEFTLLLP